MSESRMFEFEETNYLLVLARVEAAGLGSPVATDLHLFLILFACSPNANAILQSNLIGYEEARFYVSIDANQWTKMVDQSVEKVEIGDSLMLILDKACKIARESKHQMLDGLHILKAMLESPGVPAVLLKMFGTDLNELNCSLGSALSNLPKIEETHQVGSEQLGSGTVQKGDRIFEHSDSVSRESKDDLLLLSAELENVGLPVTQRVMSVLRNAHADALRRQHDAVYEIHLALGVIFEGLKTEQSFMNARTGFISSLLHDFENLSHVRYTAIPGMNLPADTHWPRFDVGVKNVLLNAYAEMKYLKSKAIDLNHVALAIVRKGDVQILSRIQSLPEGRELTARLEQCVAWTNSRVRHSNLLVEYLKLDCLDKYFLPVNLEQRPSQQFAEASMRNLSLRSKYALLFAWDKAGVHQENDVNIEHLLWGVLSAELDPATKEILGEIGLNTEFVEERCGGSIERGVRRVVPDIRLRPLSRRILARANMIAEKLGKALTEPDHILLAIFAEDRGLAQPFFEYLNIDTSEAFRSLRMRLEGT